MDGTFLFSYFSRILNPDQKKKNKKKTTGWVVLLVHYECRCLSRPEEGVDLPGTGVVYGCERLGFWESIL